MRSDWKELGKGLLLSVVLALVAFGVMYTLALLELKVIFNGM